MLVMDCELCGRPYLNYQLDECEKCPSIVCPRCSQQRGSKVVCIECLLEEKKGGAYNGQSEKINKESQQKSI